ncbi:uncharacterized protein LOC105846290 isoform X1 [Hydra vulgaris]|uniref:uncharacterized protein LOC105846290 isoform X1 n=1 Tax=Hydra vulgaris TaxID=6087 RepID=UPI001F5FED92|nr:uncharacterized protein LOC105846290 isoform X1 [Hydra vulgaris]
MSLKSSSQSSADTDEDRDWGLSADSLARVNKENSLFGDLEMQFGLATESTPAKKRNFDAEDVILKTRLQHNGASFQSPHCLHKKTVETSKLAGPSNQRNATNNQSKVLQESSKPQFLMQQCKISKSNLEQFANYSWACVRRSLNQSGLDRKKKRKLTATQL